jgi:hypothetical protein
MLEGYRGEEARAHACPGDRALCENKKPFCLNPLEFGRTRAFEWLAATVDSLRQLYQRAPIRQPIWIKRPAIQPFTLMPGVSPEVASQGSESRRSALPEMMRTALAGVCEARRRDKRVSGSAGALLGNVSVCPQLTQRRR